MITIGTAGRADAEAFLARLVRLDPGAVVRLRPHGTDHGRRVEMWAMLPFGVLASRTLPVTLDRDGDGGGHRSCWPP